MLIRRFLTPWGTYRAARDQLGSVRRIYLSRDRVVRRDDFSEGEVVLLLHGFMQTRNLWETMEERLRRDGYRVISLNMGGLFARFNTRPVDTLAMHVAEKIERLASRHGFDGLHIIGHSKGGLVGRRYIQHYGGGRRVRSLTTLGTPHHGTPTAVVAVGLMGAGFLPSSALDLLPRSRVIAALNQDVFPAHVPLVSVYSKQDLVCPYWCSVLRPRAGESSMENVVVRGVGHSQLAWDPGVYAIVRQRLARATTTWEERNAPVSVDGAGPDFDRTANSTDDNAVFPRRRVRMR